MPLNSISAYTAAISSKVNQWSPMRPAAKRGDDRVLVREVGVVSLSMAHCGHAGRVRAERLLNGLALPRS